MPKPSGIIKYSKEIERYYNDSYFDGLTKEEKLSCVNEKVESYIIDTYIDCVDINISNNDKKNEYFIRTFIGIISIIIFLFLSYIPFFS